MPCYVVKISDKHEDEDIGHKNFIVIQTHQSDRCASGELNKIKGQVCDYRDMDYLVDKIVHQFSSGIFFVEYYLCFIDDEMGREYNSYDNPDFLYMQKWKKNGDKYQQIYQAMQKNTQNTSHFHLYKRSRLQRVVAYKVGQ